MVGEQYISLKAIESLWHQDPSRALWVGGGVSAGAKVIDQQHHGLQGETASFLPFLLVTQPEAADAHRIKSKIDLLK